MKLGSLRIDRIPGLDRVLEVEFSKTFTIVTGPNASGKSSLARALRLLLFDGQDASPRGRGLVARAEFIDALGRRLRVEREGMAAARWFDADREVDAPDLPSSIYASCYLLRITDLLVNRSPGDVHGQRLTAELRRRFQGGHDLDGLAAEMFARKPRAGQREARQLGDARRRLAVVRRRHEDLAAREDQLATREATLRELSRASVDRVEIDLAIERLSKLREIRSLADQRSNLPSVVDLLEGGEVGRLQEIDMDLEVARTAVSRLRTEIKQLKSQCTSIRLEEPLEETRAASLRAGIGEIEKRQRDLVKAEHRIRAERRQLGELRRRLLDAKTPAALPVLQANDFTRLELFFDQQARVVAERATLDQEIQLLEGMHPRRARLRSFRLWWLTAGLAMLIVAMGAALASRLDPRFGWLVVVGLAALLGGFAWRRSSTNAIGRAFEDRRHYELEKLLASRRRNDAIQSELRKTRAQLERAFGFSLDLGAFASLELARLYARIGDAERRLATAEVELRVEQAMFDDEYGDWACRLADLGIDTHASPGADRVALERLISESARLAQLREQLGQRTAMLDETEARLASLVERRRKLLASCGVSDDAAGVRALERAVDALPRARDLDRRREVLSTRCHELDERLRARVDLGAASFDVLEAMREDARAREARHEDLAGAIGGTKAELRRAREGCSMADARSDIDAARTALEERFDETLDAEAGRILLDCVRRRVRDENRPPLVRAAARLFALFTHEQWELCASDQADDESLIAARDVRRGVQVSVDELSDGTRTQLMLALRLAVAFETERGVELPIFLDEALSHSDDDRFDAIAQSLLLLAHREDRQFVVLTADAADTARIRRTAERLGFEMPRVRALGESRESRDVVIPALAPERRFEGYESWSDAAWSRELAVTLPDPSAPVDALHLWWLLGQDRDLLIRLARARVLHVGAWRAVVRRGAPSWLTAAERERVEFAVAVWEAWRNSWRIGRSSRVVDDALIDSSALSDRFLEPATELLRECDRDPELFLAALARGALPRFQKRRIEELAHEWRGRGLLDPREPLDASGRRLQVQDTVIVHGVDHADAERAAHLVDVLEAATGSSQSVDH